MMKREIQLTTVAVLVLVLCGVMSIALLVMSFHGTLPQSPNDSATATSGQSHGSVNDPSVYIHDPEKVEQMNEPLLVISSASAEPGDSDVSVTVSLRNNPGILGMTLHLTYDETVMTLTHVEEGIQLYGLTYTAPRDLSSGCSFLWDGLTVSEETSTDGTLLRLYFDIEHEVPNGCYVVSMSYDDGAVIDNDIRPIRLYIAEGAVTIS